MRGPEACLSPLIRTMNIVAAYCPGYVMLVWNVMLKHKVRTQIRSECYDEAIKHPKLLSAQAHGRWEKVSPYYDYEGTVLTTMRTTIFQKRS